MKVGILRREREILFTRGLPQCYQSHMQYMEYNLLTVTVPQSVFAKFLFHISETHSVKLKLVTMRVVKITPCPISKAFVDC